VVDIVAKFRSTAEPGPFNALIGPAIQTRGVTGDIDREAFLAGDRPDDVQIYLHEDTLSNPGALAAHGESVPDGIVLLLDGEKARTIFQEATGIDPMALAQDAMDTDGDVDRSCTDASCPAADTTTHHPRLIFAFAEPQSEDVGGIYAKGPVIHAYVACACGERYSDRWVAGPGA
jgi:hypothetical protein